MQMQFLHFTMYFGQIFTLKICIELVLINEEQAAEIFEKFDSIILFLN